jgi:hypothetical protein
MALPASGPISMSMVRTETSQSSMVNYAIGGWTWGEATIACAGIGVGGYYSGYAPINVLSSGSRFSESSPLNLSNLSMSAWYNYNHTAQINTGITGTLYQHADVTDKWYPTSMLIIELGTSNTTYSINISGSSLYNEYVYVFYGKPWSNTGGTYTIPLDQLIYQGLGNINASINYNYTYNVSSGSKLYCVLANGFYNPTP